MKKALMIASVASMIEQFNMNNIKILKKLGYHIDVATNFENSGTITKSRSEKLKQELKNLEVNCFQIDFNRKIFSKDNLKAYKQIKKIINENQYNLIHMHSPIGGVCGRIAAKNVRKSGTKVIYTAHGFHFYKGAPILNWIIFYPIEKYLSKYTDCLITINQEDYERAKKKFKTKQIELVHGVGVDENKFNFEMPEEEKSKLRKSIGLKDDNFVLIQVGELNKNKNQIMAINTMKNLVKKNKDIHLLLVGVGPQENFYKEKIKENNLQNNVHMLGYRTDVSKLLKISNILLSLSYREGLPVNVIEAMMTPIPIIATDCRGNRELVKNNENGFLVRINDAHDIKSKILILYEDKKIREKIIGNSIKLVKLYSLKNVAVNIENIYKNIEKEDLK